MKRTLVLSLIVTVTGLSLASDLSFIKEPIDVIAVRDRSLMLACQVEGEGPISIAWRRNGITVVLGPEVSILENGTLLISRFQKRRDDAQALPKFHTHPESMAVDEGGVARFHCSIRGVPEAEIHWEKDWKALQTEESRYTLLPNGILQITSVRQSDSGGYRCVATNIAKTRYSNEAQLTVTVSSTRLYRDPVIVSGPQNLTLTVHQTAVLECIASGNPRPIVSWSRLDGRSIGVEGIQVLGSGNLIISDVSLQHSGIYVCSANRPGTRMRRTALGRLVVQAPPEFLQWPQSVSKPLGSSVVFTCQAQGVPEPHLIWLKNGQILSVRDNLKLTNNNSAGTNQASARLAVLATVDLPESPGELSVKALSVSSLRVEWKQPEHTEAIIGYVLHIRKLGEPDSSELQEAVSKDTFQHDFTNLEQSTTFSIYVKAYSPQGASQQSESVIATTRGNVPLMPSFFTRVLNSSALQVFWDLPAQPGCLEGHTFCLRRLPETECVFEERFPAHINTHTLSNLDALSVYEIQLKAFNGNGDSITNKRLISLTETDKTGNKAAGESMCECSQDAGGALTGIMAGIHIALACIILCAFFLIFGYRHSFFRQKSGNWSPSVDHAASHGDDKVISICSTDAIELSVQAPQCQVTIEPPLLQPEASPSNNGAGTGTNETNGDIIDENNCNSGTNTGINPGINLCIDTGTG
ncbi:hypothetical protein DNTS_008977 [Danionella cerebrum]|uniref:Immunoglobulin superfamily DCC subclass member 3-like n=1 Tax=Danionella cerebrum TaxID=2873325 RepID=A0A553Q4F1_9TELE|nr:hypothetical protein DNTS_008977 [Danionella translucida]